MERRGRLGKIAQLVALLHTHFTALEYDCRAQGVDLLDLYRGKLTYRALHGIVSNLPADSALYRQLLPGGWGPINYQIADLFDLTAVAGNVVVAKGSDRHVRARRPGDVEAEKRQQSMREQRAAAMRARSKQRKG